MSYLEMNDQVMKPVYRYVPDFEQAMQYPWSRISGKFVYFGERQSKYERIECTSCDGKGKIKLDHWWTQHCSECDQRGFKWERRQ